ncbi:hypothetical protein ACXX82_16625 [Glaciimonas sp. GNP009]
MEVLKNKTPSHGATQQMNIAILLPLGILRRFWDLGAMEQRTDLRIYGGRNPAVQVVPNLDLMAVITASCYEENVKTPAHRINALFKETTYTVQE